MKNQVLNKEFGSRLKDLREQLTKREGRFVFQYEVAEEAHLSVTSIQQAERGIIPGAAVLYKLATYYGVSVDYLKTGKPDRYEPAEQARPYLINKGRSAEGDSLYGKTLRHEVNGQEVSITRFDPGMLFPPSVLRVISSKSPIRYSTTAGSIRAI